MVAAFLTGLLCAASWIGEPIHRVPDRVVSMAPSLTEIMFELGQGHRIVGVTTFDDYPPSVASLPKVGGFVNPDPERIVSLAPELVLAVPTRSPKDSIAALSAHGISTLVIEAQHLADLDRAITTLGKLFKVPHKAQELIAKLGAQLREAKTVVAKLAQRRVLILVGAQPMVAAGVDTFLSEALDQLKFDNVIASNGYPHLDLEKVRALRPHWIIHASAGERRPDGWKKLPGQWIDISDRALTRLGPRFPQALVTVVHRLKDAS